MTKRKNVGDVKGKFVIKNLATNLLATENEDKEGMLCFRRYPVVFNSIDDAKEYLSKFDISEQDMAYLSIEPAYYELNEHVTILITFDDEDHEKRLINALETIKNECTNASSCRNCKLRHSDGCVKICYILETCPGDWELAYDNSDDRIFK